MLYRIKTSAFFVTSVLGLHAIASWQPTPTAADRSWNAQSIAAICLIHFAFGCRMSFLLMLEGCLLPIGLIRQIHISDLTCRHLRMTVWHRRSPASFLLPKRPREGRSSKAQEAPGLQSHSNGTNIDTYADSLRRRDKRANGLRFSEVYEMVATQNMCVPLGWRGL